MSGQPIILPAAMIHALLAGKKRYIRMPKWKDAPRCVVFDDGSAGWTAGDHSRWADIYPRERLWVQETWVSEEFPDGAPKLNTVQYVADMASNPGRRRTPQHMPRCASRLTLVVEDVFREMLHEITTGEILSEGISTLSKDDGYTWKFGIPDADGRPWIDNVGWAWNAWERDPRKAYERVWRSQHSKPGTRWEDNPEVIVMRVRLVRANIDNMVCAPAAVHELRERGELT